MLEQAPATWNSGHAWGDLHDFSIAGLRAMPTLASKCQLRRIGGLTWTDLFLLSAARWPTKHVN